MRIGLLIGGLGRGGAERQLCDLAAGLKGRGHEVEVGAYAGPGVFDAELDRQGIPVRHLMGGAKLGKVRAVRRWVRTFQPEVLHGFMKRASSLAVLATLPWRRIPVVGSDYSTASYGRHKPALWWALFFFSLADRIVNETEMNRRNLGRLAPWLKSRTLVIRNGVDTARFTPAPREAAAGLRFGCVGTVYPVKNPLRVVQAAHLLQRRGVAAFRVDWYGRRGAGGPEAESPIYRETAAFIQQHQLGGFVKFHGDCAAIERAYHDCDCLIHASVQEGTPNAVVEAMACGLPLVVSRVADLPLFVETARNGFVCDETLPESIADAMQRVLELPRAERHAMGERSRELAVRWFGRERFILEHEELYRSLRRGT